MRRRSVIGARLAAILACGLFVALQPGCAKDPETGEQVAGATEGTGTGTGTSASGTSTSTGTNAGAAGSSTGSGQATAPGEQAGSNSGATASPTGPAPSDSGAAQGAGGAPGQGLGGAGGSAGLGAGGAGGTGSAGGGEGGTGSVDDAAGAGGAGVDPNVGQSGAGGAATDPTGGMGGMGGMGEQADDAAADDATADDAAADDAAADDGGDPGEGGFQPCPAAEPCKILPLGDSITFGLGFDGGYRVELFRLAITDGHDVTFTGTQQPNGPGMVEGQTFPRGHEGISGETIEQINNRVPTPALGDMPHIILVHAGTNDMARSAAGAEGRLEALLDELIVEAPDALIVVSSLIPLPFAASAVNTFNAAIPGMVEERAAMGAHIIYADQFGGFPESELGDGVHPNEAGYNRMASVWFEAIQPYLP